MRSNFIDRTGEENYNKQGCLMKIIEYKNNANVIIEFQDEYKYTTRANYDSFIKGRVKNKMYRIGETKYNKRNKLMKIIEYNGYNDIVVEFPEDHHVKVHTTYKSFDEGTVKSPYDRTVYDVGYKGDGKYNYYHDHKHAWDTWSQMIRRCYDPYMINENLSYKDCFVCEEWHNFQNFAEWYYVNYYEVPGEKMQLDKDIISKHNKIYSPETCVFVPQYINSLILNKPKSRGKYPIGCYYSNGKIAVHCTTNEKTVHLGLYDSVKEAFSVYKDFKEKYIKQVADNYRPFIPNKLYKAMYAWVIEIND
jgi:hypothetical protein